MKADVNVMCRIDRIDAPDLRLHPGTPDAPSPAVFFDLGDTGGQVTLWGYDADAFRRIAEACLAAADQLDHANAPVTGVDPRD